ncbi:glycosyltransferase 87 family protein [Actinoplanes sp. CA-142083]|uniref:glycosyltransferase 87 family protein n=1 Tax=Actinoplanes sp. CA-142083 TaxID=3239903 RepID=UPI003D94785F
MPNIRKQPQHAEALLVGALVVCAVLARSAGWAVETNDMAIFDMWYHQIAAVGPWHGVGDEIGNYNAPFVYLLAALMYVPGPLVFKLKAVFVVFDVVLAFFAYKIVGLKFPGRRIPMAAALVTVLLPTVAINASWYGQMDAMWAGLAVGGVYFLLRERPWPAVALCAAALAIKPQGIFIFPLLLLLALGGRLPWRTFLAVPAVFLVLDLPALLAGRNPVELFTIYDLGRQAKNIPVLTYRAPSLYAFVPAGEAAGTVRTLGYVFTAVLVLALCYILIVRNVHITRGRLVAVAALFAIMVPFFLPGMHERYFFLADVLTVVLVFYRPRLWPVPLLVQAASLLCYEAYLFGGTSPAMLPLVVPATLMLAALGLLAHHVLKDAFDLEKPEIPDTPAELEAEINRPGAARRGPLPARRA